MSWTQTTVTKRNGDKVPYSVDKILLAVEKAFNANETEFPVEIQQNILNNINIYDGIPVEEIQEQVQMALMKNGFYKIAIDYIKYRESHKELREDEERLQYMENYSKSSDNAASSSETDPNSNVSMKNAANLEGEVYKCKNRKLQRRRMQKRLQAMYDKELADQYLKDLKDHIIYVHDEASTPVLKPYCGAITTYPLMCDGVGNIDNITPFAPNDIASFSGQITNLVFLISSQLKGAVAVGDYFVALNYYVVKQFGEHWYEKLDVSTTTEHCLQASTIRRDIRKGMKQFIYGINQPAGNRSYNSPFTNVSFYDRYYFKAMFEDFCYPDGTKPEWKAIDALQRMFMELHRELRLIKPLTFPVSTMALVHNDKDYLDLEYKELCAEEWAKGGSFFCYNSNNPSSLASCCFSKDTKFLWKSSTSGVNLTTFEEFANMPYKDKEENFKVFHNGSWVAGSLVKLPNRKMYKILTENNKEFVLTDNHINVTLKGEKETSALTTDDYLMFNTQSLDSVPEQDEHLTYEQGFAVGAFLGDGSFGAAIKDSIYQIEFSQNADKYEKCMAMINIANRQLGHNTECTLKTVVENKYPVSICSKPLCEFIIKWTNWHRGVKAPTKELNLNCLLQSKAFRQGILDGWYNTDGGNSNRCYTTSSKLAECMEAVITSLGKQSIIDVPDRTGEPVAIRDQEYQGHYPLYCVRWYEDGNHRVTKDANRSWIKHNNSIYFKIKSIEEVPYDGDVYCIECNDKEPYFTLPSGLITHNCRVLNEMSDNTFSSTTGMTGIMTGSCNVITLNINRIIQKYFGPIKHDEIVSKNYWGDTVHHEEFKKYLTDILERVYKYHIAYKTMLYEQEERGMFTYSNAGYLYVKKLYSTIGVLGYCEAAKFLGLDVSNNIKYKEFLQLVLGTIRDENKLHSVRDKKQSFLFNSEAVPGENLAVKLYQWDEEDGLEPMSI